MDFDLAGNKFKLERTKLGEKSEGTDVPMLNEDDEIECKVCTDYIV